MKIIAVILLTAGLVFSPAPLHAQTSLVGSLNNDIEPVQPAVPDSVVQITAEMQGLQAVAYSDLPTFGTYWEVMPGGGMAPLPAPVFDPSLPIYAIAGNIYLVDASYGQLPVNPRQTATMSASSTTSTTAAAVQTEATAVANLIDQVQAASATAAAQSMAKDRGQSGPPGFDDTSTNAYTPNGITNGIYVNYGTNLWIAKTAVASGYLTGIASNTMEDVSYTIQSVTNLSLAQSAWQNEGVIYGSEYTNWTPLSVAQNNRTNLFIRLRSEFSSDNSGMPTWWELQYFGTNAVDPYGDPKGDGYNNLYKYQHGMNPNSFYAPPAPQGVTVAYNANNGTATLSWRPSAGNVTNYTIERDYTNYYTLGDGESSQFRSPIGVVNYVDNVSSFSADPFENGTINVSYKIMAKYAGGNSAWTANVPLEPQSFAGNIATGSGETPTLTVMSLPANATRLVLTEIDQNILNSFTGGYIMTNISIAVGNLTNGSCSLPNPGVPTEGDYYYWVGQAVGSDGSLSAGVELGSDSQDNLDTTVSTAIAEPFYDGRAELKQNLIFQLRAALVDRPFRYEEWLTDLSNFRYFYSAFTNYAFASYYSYTTYDYGETYYDSLEIKQPFGENAFYRNFALDSSALDGNGFLTTGIWNDDYELAVNKYSTDDPVSWIASLAYQVPDPIPGNISPLLGTAQTQWLASYPEDIPAYGLYEIGATNYTDPGSGQPTTALFSNVRNLYGLAFQSINIANGGQIVTLNSGHNTTASGNLYPQTAQPQFRTVEYDFWDANQDALPGIPTQTMSGLSFSPTNKSRLMLATVNGPALQIAGYAKMAVTNGYSGAYGYLGQYFAQAYMVGANGIATTNTTGVLSPYGRFVATKPGPVAVVTMPDLDTGAQGTCTVYCVSMQVDKNHDGTMDTTPNGPDITSQSNPMDFWINDWHCVPGSGSQLDKDEPAPPDDPNYLSPSPRLPYGEINCQRDLENFARIWICGMPALTSDYQVTLSWANTILSPSINLYTSVETNGGIGYLTDTNIAAQQCALVTNSSSPYIGGPGAGIATITPSSSYTFPANYFGNGTNHYFLFEGAGEGSGQLLLTISRNGNVVAQTGVWISLHQVALMMDTVHIANAPSSPPSSTLADNSYFVPDVTLPINPNYSKQIVVFVHGWRLTFEVADDFANIMFKRLYWQGYQGRYAMVHWPTLSAETDGPIAQYLTFNRDEYIAFKCAQGLASYFTNLQSNFPGYSINVCAHSHGNIIMMEALKRLLANGQKPINNYVMMQAAVAAECLDTNYVFYPPFSAGDTIPDSFDGYAGPIQNSVNGHIYNFFNPDDFGVVTCWQPDQLLYKPDGRYWYQYLPDGPQQTPPGSSRAVTDPQELMAFMSRPRTQAVGAVPNLGGAAYTAGQQNLETLVNFSGSWNEHSGEFNWNIQRLTPFYHALGQSLGVIH